MAKQSITVVIELPEDPDARNAIKNALPLFENFHGGQVTAMYAGDAISENEIYKRNADPTLIKAVRDQVAALSA